MKNLINNLSHIVEKSVLTLVTTKKDGIHKATCFVVYQDDKSYLAICCRHSVERATNVEVRDASLRQIDATVVYKDDRYDMAVLKIDKTDDRKFECLKFRNMNVQFGSDCFMIGCQSGKPNTISQGKIMENLFYTTSDVKKMETSTRGEKLREGWLLKNEGHYQFSVKKAIIVKGCGDTGNSGSPLLDNELNLIGMVFEKAGVEIGETVMVALSSEFLFESWSRFTKKSAVSPDQIMVDFSEKIKNI